MGIAPVRSFENEPRSVEFCRFDGPDGALPPESGWGDRSAVGWETTVPARTEHDFAAALPLCRGERSGCEPVFFDEDGISALGIEVDQPIGEIAGRLEDDCRGWSRRTAASENCDFAKYFSAGVAPRSPWWGGGRSSESGL